MLLNPDKVATTQFFLKKKLEKRLIADVRRLLREISIEFEITYASIGTVIQAVEFEDELRGILTSNYRRISRNFTRDLIRAIRENPTDPLVANLRVIAQSRNISLGRLLGTMRDSIAVDARAFITQSALEDSVLITRTNQKQLQQSVDKSIAFLTEAEGTVPSNRDVARLAGRDFRNKSIARSSLIGETATQKVAEGSKDIEVNEVLSTRNNLQDRGTLPAVQDERIWVSRGDSVVRRGRFNHQLADGQRRVGGVYTVSGQQLRFPGDTSLGASAGNVARCRCASILIIEDRLGV